MIRTIFIIPYESGRKIIMKYKYDSQDTLGTFRLRNY